MDFKDISTELYREYRFPIGGIVKINSPKELNVSASGGHRIVDFFGNSHYIPPGWIHLKWESKEGSPKFVF